MSLGVGRREAGTGFFPRCLSAALAVVLGAAAYLTPLNAASQGLPPARVVAPGSCYDNNRDSNLAAARSKLAESIPANVSSGTRNNLATQRTRLTDSFANIMSQLSAEYTDCLDLYGRDVSHQTRCPNDTSSYNAQYITSCNDEAEKLDEQYGALQARLQVTKAALLDNWIPAFGSYVDDLRTAAAPVTYPSLGSSGLRSVLNVAAAEVACMPANLSCSTFFHNIGSELARRGLPADGTIWTNRQLDANAITDALNSADGSQWKRVPASQVQSLADSGVLVVAVQRHAGHGHVALAAPASDGVPDKGTGPYLRDGDSHHDPTCNCTWNTRTEAHHQSKAFSIPPLWYEWLPSASASQ
jgi:hypothetical protein